MINITPDILNRHADHLRYVYDNDESADVMSAAAGRIAQLEANHSQMVESIEKRDAIIERHAALHIEQLDKIDDMQHCIEALEADTDTLTGLLAGVGTLFTASEVLALIELLPSVQAAFERNLGGAS